MLFLFLKLLFSISFSRKNIKTEIILVFMYRYQPFLTYSHASDGRTHAVMHIQACKCNNC
jgi:hypothetical protein